METTALDTKVEEFVIDGRTLVYDFDELTLAQMKMAEAVYEFAADIDKNPPRTVEEKLRLVGDRDAKVLAILLRERTGDALAPFNPSTQPLPLLSLVTQMASKDVIRAEDCISHFFGKRGRTTLQLLVQSQYEIRYAEAVINGLVNKVNELTKTRSVLTSSEVKSAVEDSMNATSSSAGNEKPSETPTSGSLPKETP